MAWTIRTPETFSTLSTGTSRTVNKPSGTASGDVIIVTICNNGGNNPNTYSQPGGFTLEKEFTGTSNPKWSLWWKVADGTEGSTFTFGWGTAVAGSICAVSIAGADTTTPWDVTESDITDTAGTPVDVPAIAGGTAARLLIVAIGTNSSSQTFTPPTESPVWTEAWDLGSMRGQTLAYREDAAGTDGGARTWTASNTSQPRIGMFGALRPEATASARTRPPLIVQTSSHRRPRRLAAFVWRPDPSGAVTPPAQDEVVRPLMVTRSPRRATRGSRWVPVAPKSTPVAPEETTRPRVAAPARTLVVRRGRVAFLRGADKTSASDPRTRRTVPSVTHLTKQRFGDRRQPFLPDPRRRGDTDARVVVALRPIRRSARRGGRGWVWSVQRPPSGLPCGSYGSGAYGSGPYGTCEPTATDSITVLRIRLVITRRQRAATPPVQPHVGLPARRGDTDNRLTRSVHIHARRPPRRAFVWRSYRVSSPPTSPRPTVVVRSVESRIARARRGSTMLRGARRFVTPTPTQSTVLIQSRRPRRGAVVLRGPRRITTPTPRRTIPLTQPRPPKRGVVLLPPARPSVTGRVLNALRIPVATRAITNGVRRLLVWLPWGLGGAAETHEASATSGASAGGSASASVLPYRLVALRGTPMLVEALHARVTFVGPVDGLSGTILAVPVLTGLVAFVDPSERVGTPTITESLGGDLRFLEV